MMRTVDLFTIATSGVNASNTLLQTTSNNIANVNTEGYVRQRTTLEGGIVSGVGEATTERVINQFAQNQLRRDTTSVGYWETFLEKTEAIDNLLAGEANSLSQGFSEFFASLQTAADEPTNLSSRDLVLGQGRSLLRRMTTMADFLAAKEKELNLELTSQVNRANSLIKNIGDLNEAIMVASGNGGYQQPSNLLNARDQAISELASIMSVEVRNSSRGDGTVEINLTTGESLVLENGSFNLFELGSDADLTQKQLQLATDFDGAKANTALNIMEASLGGSMGGLFAYRDDILALAQRDIGQMALAFGDAVNAQNRLGMDLDMQLGGDIFTLPTFTGLNYPGTANTLQARGQITPGAADELTDADYKVTVTAVAAGVPTEVTLELLNADGTPKLDSSGAAVVYTNITVGSGYNELPGGIEVEFQSASGYAVDNEFLFQPTKRAASNMTLATNRPEDLAFASPIRVEVGANNFGGARVVGTSVTNTEVGNPSTDPAVSAFDGNGGLHDVAGSPSATLGAPQQIRFTAVDSFEVLDGESPPNVITTVTGITDYQNLLAQAEASGAGPAWPAAFSAMDDYPGYDISLEGFPAAGDTFSIVYNTDGIADNSNAIKLAELQDQDLVQLSSEASNDQRTLHEAYASLVSRTGEEAASADVSNQAATAMKNQAQEWFDSVSGVSLDEEAANLVRYQQSYAAAARILSTAQDLFNTILQAAR